MFLAFYKFHVLEVHMKIKKCISQESLKLIAMIAMFIQYGSFLLPPFSMGGPFDKNVQIPIYQIVGKLAFPIYAFLLVEGFHHTKDRKRYALRLLLVALLSELPFDLRVTLQWYWGNNNVIFTLLFGLLALCVMDWKGKWYWKLAGVLTLAALAKLLRFEYGAWGVFLILLYEVTYTLPYKQLIRLVGMTLIFTLMGSSGGIYIWNRWFNIQYFGLLALVPISLYSGKKWTYSKTVQWAFYLFYPLHLLVLYFLVMATTP